MTDPRLLRWRWLLPIAMTGIAYLLLLYSVREYLSPDCPLRGYDAPGDMEAPALIFAKLVGGPAFYEFIPIPMSNQFVPLIGITRNNLVSLAGIAVLWFWIGFEFEKPAEPRQLHWRWPKGFVAALLAALCASLVYAHIYALGEETMLPWQSMFEWSFHNSSFVRFLWTPRVSNYPQLVWMVTGTVFFGLRFAKLVRPRPLAVQERTGGDSPPPPLPTD